MRKFLKLFIACHLAIGGLVLSIMAPPSAMADDESLVTFKSLTLSTALTMAQAALENCRASGYQVAVSVVDRAGVQQVLLRDRYAGAHTPETAYRKAWTAVSFRTDTLELAEATNGNSAQSGVRFVDKALMAGGGVQVLAAGSLVAGIGISGAPSGEADDICGKAGIAAIEDQIAF